MHGCGGGNHWKQTVDPPASTGLEDRVPAEWLVDKEKRGSQSCCTCTSRLQDHIPRNLQRKCQVGCDRIQACVCDCQNGHLTTHRSVIHLHLHLHYQSQSLSLNQSQMRRYDPTCRDVSSYLPTACGLCERETKRPGR